MVGVGQVASVVGMELFEAIHTRRSTGKLSEPAPNDAEVRQLLEAAMAAPDHKELRPQRFIILQGDAKSRFGEVLAGALKKREPDATEGMLEKERNKFGRAPLIIGVAAKRLETKLPFAELVAAACASVENLLLAATALGYGSIWRTGDAVGDANIKAALGLEPEDELVGFIYIGSVQTPQKPKTPDLEGLITYWER